jgi:hypothetical protein
MAAVHLGHMLWAQKEEEKKLPSIFFNEYRRQEHEAHHSSPFRAQVKKTSFLPQLPPYAFVA